MHGSVTSRLALIPGRDQSPEKAGPERVGFGLADVKAEDLAPSGLMNAVRDHQRLGHDAAAVADLLDLGIEEHVRVGALQRPRPERLDVLIQRGAHAADLAFEIRSPRLSTSWSTRLVETPHTYACCTTASNACSERRLGSKKLGK
jgi:hypothetical protein